MGAIIGACIAKGMSAAEIEAVTTKFSNVRQLIRMVDMAGGRRGLLAGNRVRELLSEVIGAEIKFSDLKIPLAVCSVNLEDGSETVFTQGNVLNAVMASIAVPGIFTPQIVNDSQYVDGGIKNNLPVDHVRTLGAEFVIAVDVMHHDFTKLGTTTRVEHFSVTPPASFQEIYRFVAMMISEQTRLRLLLDTPDILITPNYLMICSPLVDSAAQAKPSRPAKRQPRRLTGTPEQTGSTRITPRAYTKRIINSRPCRLSTQPFFPSSSKGHLHH